MSVIISVTSKHKNICDDIIYNFLKSDIDAKFLKTTNVIDKKIEYGCDILFSKTREKHLPYIWKCLKNGTNDEITNIVVSNN